MAGEINGQSGPPQLSEPQPMQVQTQFAVLINPQGGIVLVAATGGTQWQALLDPNCADALGNMLKERARQARSQLIVPAGSIPNLAGN